jgi:hypothetical protein
MMPTFLRPLLLLLVFLVAAPALAAECRGAAAFCTEGRPGAFPLIQDGKPAAVLLDHGPAGPDPGVRRAAEHLSVDLGRVGGGISLVTVPEGYGQPGVIVGTIGSSPVIDRLVREGKLDVRGVAGEWEAYLHQVVENPVPGVRRALVVAGSDKRGTIFGAYALSEKAGVSPWHYWADVPPQRKGRLYVLPGRLIDKPKVKYRGIFINDEEPALGNWARQTFGGINAKFYERVFELILRQRGNYLWPAMWGKSLWEDDPASATLAHEMGVVLGTSHHEPMMRAHVDWERSGGGAWDYAKNAERLRAFWRQGVERTKGQEKLVTVGMRGDGDEPMTEGTAIDLLETIVRDQRQIVADVTGRPAAETPQVWALYKEVQDYYDKGMRVPDDVTLLFADDNWGNIRRLPEPGAKRPGGYGVYYHFDYVGGPRNYKWINTTQIERVWEQMHLAWRHGADRLWIVNVGDIKPMEFPTNFFLDYAWDPERWPLEKLADYPRNWAARQFGPEHAAEIGALLTRYSQFAARRKSELVGPETYSLTNHDEAERVLAGWRGLAVRAEALERQIAPEQRDAYFQLVLHPILANANLHELYVAVAKNRLYAEQGRASANGWAERARALYARHEALRRRYEVETTGGKWPHMMSQAVFGYTGWQQPDRETMPEVRTVEVPEAAALGIPPQGELTFHSYADGTRVVDMFNRGRGPLSFTAEAGAPWIRLSRTGGEVRGQTSLAVAVDWARAPQGSASAPLLIHGSDGSSTTIEVRASKAQAPRGFAEVNGVVAVEATDARFVSRSGISWQTIPHLGRTGSAVTVFPVTGAAQEPGKGPHLEFPIHLSEGGEVEVQLVLSPTLDYKGKGGLRYAVSVDGEAPQVVNVHAGTGEREWEQAVANNAWHRSTRHRVSGPGAHVVRVWMVDPGLVFQRLHVSRGPLPASYLGPPSSPGRRSVRSSDQPSGR